ncbi:MAG: rhomboid family intramembrane serine protease [Candidatus Avoscillospira sp.]
MKNFRRDFERFCYRHQNKGIHNLMLYVAIGTVVMYVFMMIDPSNVLYYAFCFNRSAILHGQIWRLFTYIFIPTDSYVFLMVIMLFFYYQIGRMLESQWGVFRFNLFYFSGVILMDIGALLLNATASVSYLNLSLILAFATLYPENRVMLFFIIPLKMKYLAWFYFVITILQVVFTSFPYNLFPIFALLNYFLFFGSSILGILPDFMQPRSGSRKKAFGDFGRKKEKPNPNWADGYRSKSGEKPYRHKCTVCGRTDTDYPNLEFRYCSKCNGYYCYCIDHINNHAHIQ